MWPNTEGQKVVGRMLLERRSGDSFVLVLFGYCASKGVAINDVVSLSFTFQCH